MLTEADNVLLTRTGPGTPMGDLFRRFWQPVLLSAELPECDGPPVRITVLTAVLVAVIAGLAPIDAIAALANAGTLAAFTAVSVCMLVMRRRAPDAPRTFRTPLAPVVGTVAILGGIYLFFSLPTKTELFFLGWNTLGLIAYFAYGRPRAGRATEAPVLR